MHIRVRMLGTLRESAGSHEKALNLPEEASVSTVIQALKERYGEEAES